MGSENTWGSCISMMGSWPSPVVGHCHCASTIRGQFRRCTTHQSRYNARVGRLFAPCIVREMLSRITSDPLQVLGLAPVPHRTTLSRRYKALYPILQDFVAFLAQYTEDLDPAFNSRELYEGKSLFKAQGPVWHQSDRQAGRIPPGLHHLDTEATWSKSAYHGWVYGYGMHLSDNRAGFPKLVQVETASVSEIPVLQAKEPRFVHAPAPETLTTDDAYTQARRLRRWAQAGVVLLTPALRWVKGRYATAYHRFIGEPQQAELLRSRRTAIEPVFDLLAQLIGATDNHKQLPLQGLANVRTCLALATLTLQVAMIANSIWGLPLRNISSMTTAFT